MTPRYERPVAVVSDGTVGSRARHRLRGPRDRKDIRLTIVISISLLLLAGTLVSVPGRASAQAGYPIEYGWIGYAGNSAIYPSYDPNATYLPSASAGSDQRPFPSYPNNTIEVGLWNSTDGQSYGVSYAYAPPPLSLFYFNVPFYAVGGSNYTGVDNPVEETYDVGAVKGVVSATGLPSDAVTGIKSGGEFRGLNASHTSTLGYGYTGDASWLGPVIDTGLTAAAVAFPPVGILVAPLAVMNTWAGYFGAYSYESSSVTDTSNNVSNGPSPDINIWGATINGSFSDVGCKYAAQFGTCGRNVFAESFVVLSTMANPAQVSPGTLQVSATNQFWAGNIPTNSAPTPFNGATANLSYLIEPTVSIGGTVQLWPGGPPASDAQINLQQTPLPGDGVTTDIQIYTNSAGQWHYFAQPGASYVDSTVTYSNGLGSDTVYLNVPNTSTSNTGQNLFASTAFSNVGELQGSVTSSSTGAAIGYAVVTLTNNANGDETSVIASSAGEYTGLFYFPVSEAPNSFHVVASGSGYCPASATLTDIGSGSVIEKNFALSPGCGGGGCVAFGTPILTATGYVPVQNLRPGQSIVEYNLTSGQLVSGALVSANATEVREILEINSGALYVTPTDQPVFIRNATFEGWLRNPQDLTTSDQLFNPVSGEWINVSDVRLVTLAVSVYDVVTTHLNDFIANGYLLDVKAG
jgi:hypothetical protein